MFLYFVCGRVERSTSGSAWGQSKMAPPNKKHARIQASVIPDGFTGIIYINWHFNMQNNRRNLTGLFLTEPVGRWVQKMMFWLLFSPQFSLCSSAPTVLLGTPCSWRSTECEPRRVRADHWTGLYLCSTSLRTAPRWASSNFSPLQGNSWFLICPSCLFCVSGCRQGFVLPVRQRQVRRAERSSMFFWGVWTQAVHVL